MKIDRGIAPPAPRGRKYPFRIMHPGDSVFYPGEFKHLNDSPAYMTAKTIQKRSGGNIQFQGKRQIEGGQAGIRIWRVV